MGIPVNDVSYNGIVREWILSNLDGWMVTGIQPEPEPIDDSELGDSTGDSETIGDVVDDSQIMDSDESGTETPSDSFSIEPFMTNTEIQNKPNKTITDTECRLFYEETLDQAYMHTNRLNIDDLTPVEARIFIRAVCKWTASNLWNKYNIRVNNEDMEDTYIQSYGGLLYKSALKTLQGFINQRVSNLTSRRDSTNDTEDVWII